MASSLDKIIEFHISRLKDKNPEVRLRAIEELLALKAKAAPALDALRECYETSEEPEVKTAAQKAGYEIFVAVKVEESGNSES